MSRLIDAGALIMKWNELAKHMTRDGDGKIPVDFGLVICEISKAPTVDAVEVVRCLECKYSEDTPVDKYRYCIANRMTVETDDFCSYGERKDGDEHGG